MEKFVVPEGVKEVKIDFENRTVEFNSKFKDGDIIADCWPTVAIYNSTNNNGGVVYYITLLFGDLTINDVPSVGIGYTRNFRLATESEKQQLFDALAKEGLKWNAEEKKIEKIRWRANEGEPYWTFIAGCVESDIDYCHESDQDRFDAGMYFKTKEQAEKAFEATKKLLLSWKEE